MLSLNSRQERLASGKSAAEYIATLIRRQGGTVIAGTLKEDFQGKDDKVITAEGETRIVDYKNTVNKFLLSMNLDNCKTVEFTGTKTEPFDSPIQINYYKVAPSNPFSKGILTTHVYVWLRGWENYKTYSVDQYYKNTFGSVGYALELIEEFESWRDVYMTPAEFEELCNEYIDEFKRILPKWQKAYIETTKIDSVSLAIT